MNSMHYVYILRCADDTLYTGWTSAKWEKVFIAFCILFVLLGYGFAHLYQKIKLAEEYGLDTALFSQVNRRKNSIPQQRHCQFLVW